MLAASTMHHTGVCLSVCPILAAQMLKQGAPADTASIHFDPSVWRLICSVLFYFVHLFSISASSWDWPKLLTFLTHRFFFDVPFTNFCLCLVLFVLVVTVYLIIYCLIIITFIELVKDFDYQFSLCYCLSLIHIWRCRRSYACRSRWSPYH